MSFSRHTSRIYMDIDDINGAIYTLSQRVIDINEPAFPYYMGALMTLNFIRNHEEIRDQSIFMQIFDNELAAHNIEVYQEENVQIHKGKEN